LLFFYPLEKYCKLRQLTQKSAVAKHILVHVEILKKHLSV